MKPKLAFLLTSFALLAGCTQATNTDVPLDSSGQVEIKAGSKPFRFDPKKVEELVIQRSDSESDQYWTATFSRRPDSASQKSDSKWMIKTSPTDSPVIDRNADDRFINHLLDSLQHVHILREAPLGALYSFALAPPLYSVRWKTADKEYLFYLGAPVKRATGYYLLLSSPETPPTIPPSDKKDQKVWIAQGSGLKLLNLVNSFQDLRKKSWGLSSPDSFDEIELIRQGFTQYAQREGNVWTNQKHKPYLDSNRWSEILKSVLSAPVLEFKDNPGETQKLLKSLQKEPEWEIRLTNRHGRKEVYRLKQIGSTLYGSNSDRPAAVFVLDPKIPRILKNLAQNISQPNRTS